MRGRARHALPSCGLSASSPTTAFAGEEAIDVVVERRGQRRGRRGARVELAGFTQALNGALHGPIRIMAGGYWWASNATIVNALGAF